MNGRIPVAETTATVVIVFALGSLIVPRLFSHRQGGPAKSIADIAELSSAIERFKADAKRYPTVVEGLHALIVRPVGLGAWNGPYVAKIPVDEWGHDYVYRLESDPDKSGTIRVVIASFGPDGKPGGDDDISSYPYAVPPVG